MKCARSDSIDRSWRLWRDSPDTLALSHEHVHVWKVKLNLSEQELKILERTLVFDEQARAERFRFSRDRIRFIAARGSLRIILSRYLGTDPRALTFSYGPRGKPSLARPIESSTLKFNVSHSGELALVAITQDREIGVDLEEIHFIKDAERIAERFFSARENVALRALSEAERLEAFFLCWTRKEAYVKATGDGLALPLDSFDVTLAPGEPARLLSVEGQPHEPLRWSLVGLTPAHGYVGAVAVQGHNWTLACWQWLQQA